MKEEEIDDVLTKAARNLHNLDPRSLRAVADTIRSSTRPVRPLPPTWVLAGGLVLVCAAIALAGAARAGFYGIEKMDLLERALIFSALIGFACAVGIGFIHEMIPGSRRRVAPGALLAIVSGVLVSLFALLFRDYQTSDFFSAGIACLFTGLLFAVPTALLAWLLLRRGFAVNPVSAGSVAGTLAGLAGLGMLELHCQNFQAAHVLVWHIAVIPLSAAVGAFVAWALRLLANPGKCAARK
ncbi:MAG: NrsF family protein [Terracidiphilus sp.]